MELAGCTMRFVPELRPLTEFRPPAHHFVFLASYNRITDGFDTADLKEAKALLEELS